MVRQVVGPGAMYRGVLEAADPIKLSFIQEIQQEFEVVLRLAREPDDKGAAQCDIRTDITPGRDALQ